jgi:hypothetical protein
MIYCCSIVKELLIQELDNNNYNRDKTFNISPVNKNGKS